MTRFRTGLEAARGYALAGRLSLRPSVGVGLRHDGGDAETGAGLDLGGGLRVSRDSACRSSDHLAIGYPERRHGVQDLAPQPHLDSLGRQSPRSHR